MKKVVIATNNAHKVEEISTALDFEGWEFLKLSQVDPYEEPEEDADTFEGNALIKARAAHEHTGLAALADDSGLVVDALGGAPGVFSARYAGVHGDDEANNAKVLAELEGVPDEERTARFACCIAFVDEDGTEITATGTIEGRIAHGLAGDGGFGYDPMFLPDHFNGEKTLAQVTQDEKNAISHRGNALRALKEKLA
ncbi:dITP/XTP pyrophosphatase [Slackia heliotrinireducens]|uniref:dITP/XTP pyrophosphatase n=1 Tax=Slackia heliotrinireducens (strain ATCC 29202 / DSM 20476 / NCTC 11029 / RHS 1) TaxID=471855 RepID=C7N4X2_SLAHD|nr:RdgB/HAM1 family non-canonical purine NTP pyrophosphatase [Slackia heliotrinireducens]ACV21957.1 non-canonical purine NTP pyrophosphatase, rdgB/HAM1 family [Slackia heliotrinireducens DSM 20476]VEG99812.1 dITP/XTP pyrophosphatase [Slackia heliotrinireducens]